MKKDRFTSVFIDHLPVEVVLSGMPRRSQILVKETRWNLGKPDRWENYKDLTEKAAK